MNSNLSTYYTIYNIYKAHKMLKNLPLAFIQEPLAESYIVCMTFLAIEQSLEGKSLWYDDD